MIAPEGRRHATSDVWTIGALVERTIRFTLLPRMTGRVREVRVKNGPALTGDGAQAVSDAITRTITTLPDMLA